MPMNGGPVRHWADGWGCIKGDVGVKQQVEENKVADEGGALARWLRMQQRRARVEFTAKA